MVRFILCDDDKKQVELLQSFTQKWANEHGLELELLTFLSAKNLLGNIYLVMRIL